MICLDRERHSQIIRQAREAGARIRLITDGDVSAAVATATPESGIDIMIGTGGAPEGVIAAAALKCMGGELQGRLVPMNDQEAARVVEMGCELGKILYLNDLVKGEDIFFASTGISDGDFLRGVRYYGNGVAQTHSVVMRGKTGTVRWIEATHHMAQKHWDF